MINLFDIGTRKVLVEKCLDLNKKGFYGMKFCSYESNKESLMVVDFYPEIKGIISSNNGKTVENFEPINLKIIESIDNNGSFEFINWIDKFERNKNTKGVDMFFFKLNSDKYQPIASLKGCSLKSVSVILGKPTILVDFFAYSLHRENS